MKNDLDIKDIGDKYRRARTEFDTQKVCTGTDARNEKRIHDE